jgi:hypothetical protein
MNSREDVEFPEEHLVRAELEVACAHPLSHAATKDHLGNTNRSPTHGASFTPLILFHTRRREITWARRIGGNSGTSGVLAGHPQSNSRSSRDMQTRKCLRCTIESGTIFVRSARREVLSPFSLLSFESSTKCCACCQMAILRWGSDGDGLDQRSE